MAVSENHVFTEVKGKLENKNPTWASITYGVFLCIDCASKFRCSYQLRQTHRQLRAMMFGGNYNAQVFFKEHGWTDHGQISAAKYTSRAAALYRHILAKEASSSSSDFKEDLSTCSDEARNKFPNAKSISSAQFFGSDDDELESLDKFSDNLWWFVKKMEEQLAPREDDRVDVYGLRRELAELTHKLRSKDADSIPFDTRRDTVLNLTYRVRAAVAFYRNPK